MRGYIDGHAPDVLPRLESRIRALVGEKFILPAINALLNSLCALLLVSGPAVAGPWPGTLVLTPEG